MRSGGESPSFPEGASAASRPTEQSDPEGKPRSGETRWSTYLGVLGVSRLDVAIPPEEGPAVEDKGAL